MQDDVGYFRRRAKEERERAAQGTDLCARKAHDRLATEYDRLASLAEADRPVAVAR